MSPGCCLETHYERLLEDKVSTNQHKTCEICVSGLEENLEIKTSILFNEEICITNTPDGK